MQIEHVLDLIDSNIDASMNDLYPEILASLKTNMDELAQQISEKGYAEIKTRLGTVRISKEDVQTAA